MYQSRKIDTRVQKGVPPKDNSHRHTLEAVKAESERVAFGHLSHLNIKNPEDRKLRGFVALKTPFSSVSP